MNKPLNTWKDIQAAKEQMNAKLVSQEIRWMNHYDKATQKIKDDLSFANLIKKSLGQVLSVSKFKSTSGLAMQLGYRVSQFLFKKRASKKQPQVTPISPKK